MKNKIYHQICKKVDDQVWDQVLDQVLDQVRGQVNDRVLFHVSKKATFLFEFGGMFIWR